MERTRIRVCWRLVAGGVTRLPVRSKNRLKSIYLKAIFQVQLYMYL
jgi:hypothetical protein